MRLFKEHTIMSAKSSAGAGNPVNCADYRFAMVSFATDGGGTADLTVQFQGAISDGATAEKSPAFGSAQSVTNMWDYVEVIDMEDGAAIDGDTGVAPKGAPADDYRLFQVNVDGLKYFNARITTYAAGSLTIKAIFFGD